ncbi:hypothetical protein [Caldibacillus thermoamylovorans]|nr:hypothetical protein [Caldibacillus thermoamylovorans]
MATRVNLVTIWSRKTPFFDDEIHSRHCFESKNTNFWRRDPFSSLI